MWFRTLQQRDLDSRAAIETIQIPCIQREKKASAGSASACIGQCRRQDDRIRRNPED